MIITSPVTKAKPADRDQIIAICKEDHSENGQFSLSLDKVKRTIDGILDKHEGVIGLIRRSDIEAIMIMKIEQFWYTDDWCLSEMLNFVRPAFRRSTNAKDMIAFAKRCSDELALALVIGVVANDRTKPKMELYRRQLGEPMGGYFIWNQRFLAVPSRVSV